MTSSDVPLCQSRLKVKRDREQIQTSGVFFYFQRLLSAARSRLRIKRVLFGIDRPGNGGWPTTFELPTSENRPKSPGYMWNYKKDSKKPETTRGPDLEDRQLDFEYLAQSRF